MTTDYEHWLRYVFDRPTTPNGWYFDLEEGELDASDADLARLVTQTCSRSEVDLLGYTDAQVAHGLTFMFNPSASNVAFALKARHVPRSVRLSAIESIADLYAGCFAKRCEKALCHGDDVVANPLNIVCYMLWDVSPLSYWEGEPQKRIFYRIVLKVMESALFLDHPACVESALHGLNHLQPHVPVQVRRVIGDWIQGRDALAPALRSYAAAAMHGRNQ
jgi:hypothetical protein